MGSGFSREEHDLVRQAASKVLTIDPTHAADIIVDGIERRRGRVLVGGSAKVLDLLARLLPASHGKILAAAARAGKKSGSAAGKPEPVTRAGRRDR
jgi:hypothetical protein